MSHLDAQRRDEIPVPLRVLVVDDSPDDAILMVNALQAGGFKPQYTRVDSAPTMREALATGSWDLVLADYTLPNFSGPAALQVLHDSNPDLPFILVSGTIGEERAVEMMKAGAHDYVLKDNLARLAPVVARELRDAQARQERRRAEARFRTLFEQSPLSIQIFSPDGFTLEVNHAWEALWGVLGQRQTYDLKQWNILHDKQIEAQGIMPFIQKGFAGETAETPEVSYDPAKMGFPGRPRWLKAFIYPVKDENGRVFQVVLTHVDITELVETEKALRESQQQLQAIMDNSLAVIYLKDIAGRYLLINRRFEELFHVSKEAIIGRTDYDIFPTETAEIFRINDTEAFDTGKAYEQEEQVPQDDGMHTYLSIKCPLLDANGVPYAVCGISTDITPLKEADQAKNQFLNVISHEMRTPLTAIIGWAQLAQSDPATTPEALQVIIKSAQAQKATLDRLIILSRILTGRLALQRTSGILWPLVEEVVGQYRSILEAHQLILRMLPPEEELPVDADQALLRLAIGELIDNAIKFTPPGGTITISGQRDGISATLTIEDTGRGMVPEQIASLRAPFTQIRREERLGGFGVGLALVRGIVEAHGGQVSILSSGLARGSRITMVLPGMHTATNG